MRRFFAESLTSPATAGGGGFGAVPLPSPEMASAHEAGENGAAECCREDTRLAAAAARGDAGAFQELMARHGAALHRFCHRWLDCAEDARDVTQEAFVRAWRALNGGYDERGKFKAWLWRVALNLCRDRRKSRAVRLRWLAEEDPAAWTAAGAREAEACPPDVAAARRADMETLALGMEALPEGLREPLWLCCFEELSQAECGAVLGMSERAVEGRVRRARAELLRWWNARERA